MKNDYPHIDPNQARGPEPDDFFRKVEVPYSRSKEEVWAELEAKLIGTPSRPTGTPSQSTGTPSQSTGTPSRLRIYRYPLLAAASLVLLAGIFSLLYFHTTRIISPAGQHLSHILPDGSSVKLNAGSEISYKTFRWYVARQVNFEGEAFFEVTKGKKFEVLSGRGSTEVLGTSFNIYSRDEEYKVTCITGTVRVKSFSDAEAILTPDYEATMDPQGNITVSKEIKSGMNHAWINNMFYFAGRPLPLVLEEIGRQFNITISTDQAYDFKYTGYFSKDRSAEEVLELVCKPFGLTFVRISEDKFEIHQD